MRSWRAGTLMVVAACGIILLASGLWTAARRAAPDTRVYRIGWENDPPFQVALAHGTPGGLATEVVRGSGAAAQHPLEMDPPTESRGWPRC